MQCFHRAVTMRWLLPLKIAAVFTMIPPAEALGLLSWLPYEIREQIWLEFLPAGADPEKTDLRILRTTRYLYNEISEIFFLHSRLEFILSPRQTLRDSGLTVLFYRQKSFRDTRPVWEPARWDLETMADIRDRGFYNVPFHKIPKVVVSIAAPNYHEGCQLYSLWQKARILADLLRMGSIIEKLEIRLQPRGLFDWGMWCWASSTGRYDHDVVVMPFCALPNLLSLEIKHDPLTDNRALDWETMNWAMGRPLPDIDGRMAEDYFWMHCELLKWIHGPVADVQRRDFFAHWFLQGRSGYSPFESEVARIVSAYPEIIRVHNFDMDIIHEAHQTMVCLYYHCRKRAQARLGGDSTWIFPEPDMTTWDPQLWYLCFPRGIPRSTSRRYRDDIKPLVGCYLPNAYKRIVRAGGLFSTMPFLIERWFLLECSTSPAMRALAAQVEAMRLG
ncbi:hypothetical protein CPC735_057070 [Coccidioides posadasii C735 delta SOWgp]|nr:hypothetical protein CPC735_057070 [Coccidioides posadasii C735 delta SOWgp]EER24337.1 hypothetical protein CPC735_057070 [Coccidioides posadasii C735 delta SOWgp]|eukprot:XP_003066482.1 hypothetical protein CPC735_057070 [Coccidioides posadasii C735 delta SOWgp]